MCDLCASILNPQEMLRRFLLVGLMVVVVEQGTAMQVLVGTLLAAVFLLLQVGASPTRLLACAI